MKNAYISINNICIQTVIQLSGHAYVNYLFLYIITTICHRWNLRFVCFKLFDKWNFGFVQPHSTFQPIIPDNGSSITNACFPNVLMKKWDMVMFWLASNFERSWWFDWPQTYFWSHQWYQQCGLYILIWQLDIHSIDGHSVILILETMDEWKFWVLPQR